MIQIRKKFIIIIIFAQTEKEIVHRLWMLTVLNFSSATKKTVRRSTAKKCQKSSKNCMRKSEMKCVQTPFECNKIQFVNVNVSCGMRSLSG